MNCETYIEIDHESIFIRRMLDDVVMKIIPLNTVRKKE